MKGKVGWRGWRGGDRPRSVVLRTEAEQSNKYSNRFLYCHCTPSFSICLSLNCNDDTPNRPRQPAHDRRALAVRFPSPGHRWTASRCSAPYVLLVISLSLSLFQSGRARSTRSTRSMACVASRGKREMAKHHSTHERPNATGTRLARCWLKRGIQRFRSNNSVFLCIPLHSCRKQCLFCITCTPSSRISSHL